MAHTIFKGQNARRLLREYADSRQDPVDFASYELVDGNHILLLGKILGPAGTPYEGGVFHLKVEPGPNYPNSPPLLTFLSKVYHPNIDYRGTICMDILAEQWCPALTIMKLLISVASRLDDPGLDDPLVPEVAEVYLRDQEQYEANVKLHVQNYASWDSPSEEQMAKMRTVS